LLDGFSAPEVVYTQRQKVVEKIVVGRNVIEHLRYFFFFGLT
jgi:hypothetical protein